MDGKEWLCGSIQKIFKRLFRDEKYAKENKLGMWKGIFYNARKVEKA